jgi:serine protease Do
VVAAVALATGFCMYGLGCPSAETSSAAADLDDITIDKPEMSVEGLFGADRFSRATISRVYSELSPALVVVHYAVEVYDRNSQRTRKRSGHCLGVLVRPSGLVLAPGHVNMTDAEPIDVRIRLLSQREYDAHVLPKDKNLNVTFFQIDSSESLELPYAEFADQELEIGDQVMVVGVLTPATDFARTFELGWVSSVIESPRNVYATTVPVTRGLMGGPVVNVRGEVVGVIGRDLAPSEGGQIYVRYDHPMVYPTKELVSLIETPPSKTQERVRNEAWLGAFIQPLSDELAEYWQIEPTGGIVISGVIPRSPAEKAGIVRGDIVKSVGGTPVTVRHDAQVSEFTKLIREVGANRTVRIRLLRGGQPVDVDVELTVLPKESDEAERYKDTEFGLTVREMTVDVILYGELEPTIQGVVVHSVVSAGWAGLAGLKPDDIIMAVGDEKIAGLDDFKRVLDILREARPAEIVVFAQRGLRTAFFRIEPQWDSE